MQSTSSPRKMSHSQTPFSLLAIPSFIPWAISCFHRGYGLFDVAIVINLRSRMNVTQQAATQEIESHESGAAKVALEQAILFFLPPHRRSPLCLPYICLEAMMPLTAPADEAANNVTTIKCPPSKIPRDTLSHELIDCDGWLYVEAWALSHTPS
jgi:hypothetical protein